MAVPAPVPAPVLDDPIRTVRRFNRFYTRQIGVLHENLLASQFSLTEVRVLYELAHREQVSAKELCQDLGLDRGYLSRMLQNFETQRWIKTTRSRDDRRRQFLALTSKGHTIFDPLERRSNDEVSAMLGKLSPSRQRTLVAAMRKVEGLLAPAPTQAAGYILRTHRPGDIGWVVQRHGELYWQEYHYDERFEALVAGIVAEFIERMRSNVSGSST